MFTLHDIFFSSQDGHNVKVGDYKFLPCLSQEIQITNWDLTNHSNLSRHCVMSCKRGASQVNKERMELEAGYFVTGGQIKKAIVPQTFLVLSQFHLLP